ncbi:MULTISPECIES: hypothetical protein [Bradyrhizobium]|uniref:Secreted protein n=1 Tax=Bradyrhizobium diversitatis TaxID=2755406 RepID=A0ABS0P3H1_9BRAD|nr:MULTISPECIES: hypothetical protein [Bradyrhizobium]MBH5387815.1 hypothetical protein [Bradyrhizobium diversitatis]UPJ66521.1 hypothetical protein IVB23_03855 [Bradyrhizobium sp. 191]
MRSALPIAIVFEMAATIAAWIRGDALVVQSCCSRLVFVGHRSQPLRGFAVREIVRDAATAFSVIEQSAFLDVHPATTLEEGIGPSAGCRNSAMSSQRNPGKNSNISMSPRNVALEPTFYAIGC